VLEVLGQGGMGLVFPSRGRRLATPCRTQGGCCPPLAVKLRQPPAFSCVKPEQAAAVEHDHIIAIHQVGEDRGVPLPGDASAARRIAGPAPCNRQPRLVPGRGAAHRPGDRPGVWRRLIAENLIHRDIKPANIWLEDRSGTLSSCGERTG